MRKKRGENAETAIPRHRKNISGIYFSIDFFISKGATITMKDYIEARVMELAAYVLETQTTVRKAAKHFKISRSTVHKDLTERLTELNPALAAEVKNVLENNKVERHIRGGMATKNKYMQKRGMS